MSNPQVIARQNNDQINRTRLLAFIKDNPGCVANTISDAIDVHKVTLYARLKKEKRRRTIDFEFKGNQKEWMMTEEGLKQLALLSDVNAPPAQERKKREVTSGHRHTMKYVGHGDIKQDDMPYVRSILNVFGGKEGIWLTVSYVCSTAKVDSSRESVRAVVFKMIESEHLLLSVEPGKGGRPLGVGSKTGHYVSISPKAVAFLPGSPASAPPLPPATAIKADPAQPAPLTRAEMAMVVHAVLSSPDVPDDVARRWVMSCMKQPRG